MKRLTTTAIMLKRTNYGEADRIVTFITPKYGKISAMAKGVRKPKSKLAGGIELFSVSAITLLKGRGNLDQLISSRLEVHFDKIVANYDVLQVGYKAIALTHAITEDDAEPMYFDLLRRLFELLDQSELSLAVAESWYYLQLLRVHGYLPNLTHDQKGIELTKDATYNFSHQTSSFEAATHGLFHAHDITAWRVLSQLKPEQLHRITGLEASVDKSLPVLQQFVADHIG